MDELGDALRSAVGLAAAGRRAEAAARCARVLALAPERADALNLLGVWAAEAGETARAVTLLSRLHALLPGNPAVRANLAGAWVRWGAGAYAAGDRAAAAAAFRRALELRPEDADGWCNLGAVLDPAAAAGAVRRALALAPDLAAGWRALARLGDGGPPPAAWTRTARLAPDDAEARLGLAAAHAAAGRPEAEAAAARSALALDPGRAAALVRLGAAFGNQGEAARSETVARRALRLDPALPGAWANLAGALHRQGRGTEADAPAQRAVALLPDGTDGWNNLALALLRRNHVAAAGTAWTRTATLDPEHAAARWHLSFLLLLRGRLAEGWPAYEWRWKLFPDHPAPRTGRRWAGEDPRGLAILLLREQGLGDAVQFVRFAATLKARGARVLVEGPAALRRLLSAAPGVDGWVDAGEEPPPHDRHVPLMSLPGLLGVGTPDAIPAPVPYLRAEPERVALWRERLRLHPGGPGLRVGLVWRGSAAGGRSVPAAALAPLGRVPGVRWIALHKAEETAGDALPDGLAAESPGPDFDAGPDAFLDSAAVAVLLDLVVSVDTAAAHVAGALGVPVWLMLGAPPDWRWFLDRGDTPWYPGHRLFRQPAPGGWDAVVARVADALAGEAARRQAARFPDAAG